MAPKYRLQVLLDLRERAEQEKKDQLANTKKILFGEQQKAEELRKQHQEMKDNREAKKEENVQKMQNGELGVNEYLNAERYIERLDQEIEDFKGVIKEQDKKVIFAEQEVEWAQEELIKATQEYKALQKHKEKWEAAYKKERKAKEEMQQEEISMTLHMFRDK